MKKPTETDLVRAVLQLLAHHRLFCWRANSGGGLRHGRYVRGNPEGTPDVLAVIPWAQTVGRLWGIECKVGKGRLRPAQEAWIANAERAGAKCVVIRDVKELETILRAEGVI